MYAEFIIELLEDFRDNEHLTKVLEKVKRIKRNVVADYLPLLALSMLKVLVGQCRRGGFSPRNPSFRLWYLQPLQQEIRADIVSYRETRIWLAESGKS